MDAAKSTIAQAGAAFREDGAVGSQFKEDGSLGGTAQAIGGPFDKDGAIGKQFGTDGSIGGSVEVAAEKVSGAAASSMENPQAGDADRSERRIE